MQTQSQVLHAVNQRCHVLNPEVELLGTLGQAPTDCPPPPPAPQLENLLHSSAVCGYQQTLKILSNTGSKPFMVCTRTDVAGGLHGARGLCLFLDKIAWFHAVDTPLRLGAAQLCTKQQQMLQPGVFFLDKITAYHLSPTFRIYNCGGTVTQVGQL